MRATDTFDVCFQHHGRDQRYRKKIGTPVFGHVVRTGQQPLRCDVTARTLIIGIGAAFESLEVGRRPEPEKPDLIVGSTGRHQDVLRREILVTDTASRESFHRVDDLRQ